MSWRDWRDPVREADRFAIEEGEAAFYARMHLEEGEPIPDTEGYDEDLWRDDPNAFNPMDPFDNPPLDELERRHTWGHGE